MHPWIKSDKPGRCTICGMELTPVVAGAKGDDASTDGNLVELTQNQIQVLHVQTAETAVRSLNRTLRVAGVITENAIHHRVLSTYIDGRIDKLYLNYLGEEVSAGQPLAEFYSPTLLQAEREYRQLGGELRQNTALRLRQMGLTPEQIAALGQKPADSLTSQILSPISGTVVSQAVYAGQYVATGERLFELADFSTVWFMFRAYEQDMPWIQTGMSVRITTPAIPDKSFTGKITFIDPNFDSATRSTSIRVELPNPPVNGKRELLNRLYADGMVDLAAPEVLTVPRPAVIETGPEAVAYVDHGGGSYERRVLKTGRRGDSYQEILSGLKPGDRVVTNGNLLIDGQAEMNRSFMTPAEPVANEKPTAGAKPVPVPATPATLSDAQQQSIAAFVKLADAMAAALATDDLTAFTTASAPAKQTTEAMVKQLSGKDLPPTSPDGRDLSPKGPRQGVAPEMPKPDSVTLDALASAANFQHFDDLKSARVAFHKFSVAATTVLEPMRKAGGMPDFQVYECGMVNQAIPGAPKKGHWIQTGGRELRNPFFGKEMPDCGELIQP